MMKVTTAMAPPHIPHLQATATSKQLIVHGKAFLIRGAELQNSSFSSAKHMKNYWESLADMNLSRVRVTSLSRHCRLRVIPEQEQKTRTADDTIVMWPTVAYTASQPFSWRETRRRSEY